MTRLVCFDLKDQKYDENGTKVDQKDQKKNRKTKRDKNGTKNETTIGTKMEPKWTIKNQKEPKRTEILKWDQK